MGKAIKISDALDKRIDGFVEALFPGEYQRFRREKMSYNDKLEVILYHAERMLKESE